MPRHCELEKHLKQSFLEHDFDELDNVYFKQWVHREKSATIVDMTLTVNDFIDQVCSLFDSLRWNYFIAKAQSQFLNELKENLQQNQCIVLIGFAENYSFIVQDAIQGHHWNNSQATSHPFITYFKNEKKKKELHCRNLCIVSDCLKLNANTVCAFISEVKPLIKK